MADRPDHGDEPDGRAGGEGRDAAAASDHAGEDSSGGALRRAAGLAKAAATGAIDYVQDKRFEKTPAGKARAAFEAGAQTFHIRLDLADVAHRGEAGSTTDPRVDDAIGGIEAEGWRLEDLEYVSESEEWETTDEEGAVTRGSKQETFAVMLFRRNEG